MTNILEYCTKAVIQHLHGDMYLFEQYRDMAIQAYDERKYIAKIADVIPGEIKQELYRMVS